MQDTEHSILDYNAARPRAREYLLDSDDIAYIEQLTRWRLQELRSRPENNPLDAHADTVEQQHLTALRSNLLLSNSANALEIRRKQR